MAELVLVTVCSYEVVLKNKDTKGQLMSLQQTLRQEIHAKIGAQTAEESAKRKVCLCSMFPAYQLSAWQVSLWNQLTFSWDPTLRHMQEQMHEQCLGNFCPIVEILTCQCVKNYVLNCVLNHMLNFASDYMCVC